MQTSVLKQRSDYTFRFNTESGRHGWLRLTPAYSVKVVEEILADFSSAKSVLDPFCGTGTTALSAIYRGKHAVSIDINSFLVWVASTKCKPYSDQTITITRALAKSILQSIEERTVSPIPPPPIYDIDRWWNPKELLFLRVIKGAIDSACSPETPENDLLRITFCRVLIKLSNAAFNHQSMSFKDMPTHQLTMLDQLLQFDPLFEKELGSVLASARHNPVSHANIILGDSRNLEKCTQDSFDLLITSPPYPNRMSYIRELRPYMYWLGYLKEAREAGEIDWETIGGTWGIATSRLMQWQPSNEHYLVDELSDFLAALSQSKGKNAILLANYVSKYFADIWDHLNSVRNVLSKNAAVNYIVGNSSFYGIILPVEVIYQKMLGSLGFQKVKVTPIRKRNSKKALFEFNVSALYA